MVGNFDFLKGNVETIILNALYSGDKYGYEITREIKEKTGNQYEIKQPTLYGYLKKLESQELIESYWGTESNGGRRRYYRLTGQGKELCIEYKSEWKFHKSVMESLVDTESDPELPEKSQSEVSAIFGRKPQTRKPRSENIVTLEDLNRINALLSENETDNDLQSKRTEDDGLKTSVATGKNTETSQPPQQVSYFEKIEKQESKQEKEYKSILDNLVGEQLKDKEKRVYAESSSTAIRLEKTTAPDEVNHLQLSETADAMAKLGLRMKLFNRVASVYKPAPFLPINKLNFFTALFGALAIAVEMILFWLCVRNRPYGKSAPFLVIIGVAVLVAFVFGIIWLVRPTKKVKPRFNQKFHIINSVIFFVVACTAVLVVDLLLLNLVFSDTRAVIMELVLPIVVLANVPIYVLINAFLRKKLLHSV